VYSSMICISPLESSKRKGASQPQTPMNYNDVFASPRVPSEASRPDNLPFLGDSPTTRGTNSRSHKDGNLDAHMAERDLMEDEDLSVLLQLASHSNAPGGAREGYGLLCRSRFRCVLFTVLTISIFCHHLQWTTRFSVSSGQAEGCRISRIRRKPRITSTCHRWTRRWQCEAGEKACFFDRR
jgi:hypothetical protein